MLSKTRTTIIALVATFSVAGIATTPAFAAGKSCTVEVTDGNGKTSKITMEDGATIPIGQSEITCNNGNTTTKPVKSQIGPEVSPTTPLVRVYRAPTTYRYF
jgi:hypothetical protein